MLDSRERAAGALMAAGANVRHESLKSIRRAMEYFLATLAAGDVEEVWLQVGGEAGSRAPSVASCASRCVAAATTRSRWRSARRRAAGRPDARQRNAKAVEAARALAREVEDMIGDGVLLHPPFAKVGSGTAAPSPARG